MTGRRRAPVCFECTRKKAVGKWGHIFCSQTCAARYGLRDAQTDVNGAPYWCPVVEDWTIRSEGDACDMCFEEPKPCEATVQCPACQSWHVRSYVAGPAHDCQDCGHEWERAA